MKESNNLISSLNHDSNDTLMAIDFFCGAGGLTNGLISSGIKVLAGIDIDINCKDTYERNNPGSRFFHSSIENLDPVKLSNELEVRKNLNNLILCACSPCQFFSQLNTNRTKSSITMNLLNEFQKFTEYFNPGYILIENVPPFKNHKLSPIKGFKKFLLEKKYQFIESVLLCSEHGVAQSRRRYILLASRLGTVPSLPKNDGQRMTVRQSIGDLSTFYRINAGHKDLTSFQHTSAALSNRNTEKIKKVTNSNPTLRKGFRDSYTRMSWDAPAPTVTTKFNSFSNGRFGHPDQDRAISLREGATLQSFPLNYFFYTRSTTRIAKMIGNAVPPELAKRIGQAIWTNWNLIHKLKIIS